MYHYHAENQTELEGLFARGDRRVGRAIELAYRRGCIYDAWSEYMKYDVWLEVLKELGISFDFYNFRERPMDELFPWDFIDIGVTKEFLAREWQRAKEGKVTPNCREQCSGCGARCFGGGVCFEGKN